MRLRYDPPLEAFRAELGEWLAEHRPDADEVARDPALNSAHLPDWERRWIRAQFDAGWLRPSWPRAYGGRSITAEQEMVYFEEYAKRRLVRSTNSQGLDVFAPSVYDFGSSDQHERFLLPLLRGEASAALGMSEPGAGSDLASLSTRAVQDGDRFVVNGQKVWTSGASDADFIILFVRTDTEVPKHAGISVLLVDRRITDGITVRPLSQATGPDHFDFDEVFFDDALVPAENLLGTLGQGWAIVNGSLAHERLMVWLSQATLNRSHLQRLIVAAQARFGGSVSDAVWRDRIAAHEIDALALDCMGYRSVARARRELPAPEQSLLKLFGTEAGQQITRTELELLGCEALIDSRAEHFYTRFDPFDSAFAPFPAYVSSFGETIAAGSSQIQRNIIAERILGLPRTR